MGLVIAIDAIAITGYFAFGVRTAPPGTRLAFTGIWMAATLLVVLVGLARIRRARLMSSRPR